MKRYTLKVLSYFLNGLLIVIPIILTIYIIVYLFETLDGIFKFKIPGLGLLVLITGITLIGYIAGKFVVKPLFKLLENILTKAPFIKLIYTSIRDLMEAFVGDKKKFNKPVLVQVGDEGFYKLGFITKNEMDEFQMKDFSAVYFPHSYNFSGNVFIVHKDKIRDIDVNSTDLMKFIVSGGVTRI